MSKRKIITFFSASIVAVFAMFQLATAQDTTGGGNGLQIAPTRTEISVLPGEVKPFSFNIKNITSGPLTATVVVNDFASDGISGNPQIETDTSQRTPTSIIDFVTGLENYTLKAGESQKVDLIVSVPVDAAPGAYFGVIRYTAVPADSGASPEERQLALNASLGHLVLIEVPGDINEQIQIESLTVARGEDQKSIFFQKPDNASVGVNNLGNGFSRPFGNVFIKDMFNKEVYSYEVNQTIPAGVVLPNSSRVFTDAIEGVSSPGRYTTTASIAYGNGGEVVVFESSFWYLPVWFLLTLLAVIVAIAVLIRHIYKRNFSSSSNNKTKST